jgi:hypothetical protein
MAASFIKALLQMRRAKVYDESWDSGWVFDIKTDAAPGAGGNPSNMAEPSNVSAPEHRSVEDQLNAEDSP